MIPGRIPGRELWEVEDKLYLSDAVGQTGELKIYGGTAGEKALEILYGSTSVLSIIATSSTVRILGGAAHCIQFGDAGTTSRSLNSNNDVFFSGKIEVDGQTYFDGQVQFINIATHNDDRILAFGNENDSQLDWSTAQTTSHCLVWGLGNDSKMILFCDKADVDENFDHAAQGNPTIFVHSITAPDSANDEWISFSHDVTDGVIAVGSGTLNLGGSTVNLVNTTRTASTVTHDAFAVIEIGGTEYKFMLGS